MLLTLSQQSYRKSNFFEKKMPHLCFFLQHLNSQITHSNPVWQNFRFWQSQRSLYKLASHNLVQLQLPQSDIWKFYQMIYHHQEARFSLHAKKWETLPNVTLVVQYSCYMTHFSSKLLSEWTFIIYGGWPWHRIHLLLYNSDGSTGNQHAHSASANAMVFCYTCYCLTKSFAVKMVTCKKA